MSSSAVDATPVGGGVSNIVFAIVGEQERLLFKQALPALRVADEWLAKRERTLTEGAALRLASSLTPGAVPRVVDVDAEAFTLTMELAPQGWQPWKAQLMAGQVVPARAGRLGELLARWHAATHQGGQDLLADFNDWQAFVQLRVDPYYRTVAARRPELAATVMEYAGEMAASRLCLVHGDFSPKNVLVGRDTDLWVIDFEVAHRGDPVFDVAFLLSHLVLKSIHRPVDQACYAACADAFQRSYRAQLPSALWRKWPYVLGHVGCLLLARVDGKSPVEYLDAPGRVRARRLGASLAFRPPASLAGLWRRLRA